MRRAVVAFFLLTVAVLAAAAPKAVRKTPSRSAPPPIDFSGIWELDPKLSEHIPPAMKKAVLSVTQKGNRLWITPIYKTVGTKIMAEEIVVDGRRYEKALGPAGKGTVMASWAKDGQSLLIEIHAGEEGNVQSSALQRSVWKLSADHNVWVRESFSMSRGRGSTTRLVFRRRPSEAKGTAAPAGGSNPSRTQTSAPARTRRPVPTRTRTPGP